MRYRAAITLLSVAALLLCAACSSKQPPAASYKVTAVRTQVTAHNSTVTPAQYSYIARAATTRLMPQLQALSPTGAPATLTITLTDTNLDPKLPYKVTPNGYYFEAEATLTDAASGKTVVSVPICSTTNAAPAGVFPSLANVDPETNKIPPTDAFFNDIATALYPQ